MMEQMSKKRIPDGWEVKPLNQILSLFGRIGFRGYNVTDLVQEGKGAITLSPSNIENGIVTFNKCTYLSWEKYKESPEIMIEEGDILLVKTGSTYGKIGYVESLPWPSTINPQYVVLKKFNCNSRLLAYLLEQKEFQDQIESITSGGAIPTMSQAKIYNCTVTLPSDKNEQSRIATALSDVDELIETLKKLIEKKRYIKQGAMQELLSGKRRLSGFTEKWVDVDFCNILYTQNSKSKQIEQKEYEVYGEYSIVDQGKTTIVGYTHRNDPIRKENGPYIIFGDHTCYFKFVDFDFFLGADGTQLLKCYTGYDTKFINYLCQRLVLPNTGYDRHFKYLKEVVFTIPRSVVEQQAIATILSEMDDEISMLESRLTKYQSMKQGMMQQLLTGKIRLI